MAFVYAESYQRLRSSADYARTVLLDGSHGWSSTGGRNGGPSASSSNATVIRPTSPVPSGSTAIWFSRFNFTVNREYAFGFGNNINNQTNPHLDGEVEIRFPGDGSGDVTVRRGATVVTTASGVITGTALQAVAVELVIHGSAGSVRIVIDGVEVLNATGLNTSRTGGTSWTDFYWYGGGAGQCDLAVFDGTNPTGNDPHELIPDLRVDYRPANGNGYSSQFVGSDANSTDNYLLVDDNGASDPDDDSTYVESDTPAIDGYALADAPDPGATIIGVVAYAHARKTDAGVVLLEHGLRVDGVNYLSDPAALAVTYRDLRKHFGVNPDTNAGWTESEVNALELVIEKS